MNMAEQIDITLNGKPHQVETGTSIAGLLEVLNIDKRGVAVEQNRRIVRRADHPTTPVCPNDVIEIVSFVGGG